MARGTVVDEPALIEALAEGRLGHAALDVFESEPDLSPELLKLPNVIVQPHHGSATIETRTAIGQLMIDNISAHFAGKPLLDAGGGLACASSVVPRIRWCTASRGRGSGVRTDESPGLADDQLGGPADDRDMAEPQIVIEGVNHLYRPPSGRPVLALEDVSLDGRATANSWRCSGRPAAASRRCSI